jgi:CPA1 family monovalent cation:H+ antiporter
VTLGCVLLIRPLWLLLTESLPRWAHSRLGGQGVDDGGEGGGRFSGRLSVREIVVLSWAGTRGVISLAAIFTLPLTTDSGAAFPARDLLLFCTFLAVLVTLVGQGLTFAPVVRALGCRADQADEARLRNQARIAAVEAGLARLESLQSEEHDAVDDQVIASLRAQLRTRLDRYGRRLDLLSTAEGGEIPLSPTYEAALRLRRAVIAAEREEMLRWRDAALLPDEGLRILERELDHEEGLLPSRGR